jgi:hypothetical protein
MIQLKLGDVVLAEFPEDKTVGQLMTMATACGGGEPIAITSAMEPGGLAEVAAIHIRFDRFKGRLNG